MVWLSTKMLKDAITCTCEEKCSQFFLTKFENKINGYKHLHLRLIYELLVKKSNLNWHPNFSWNEKKVIHFKKR